MPFTAAVGATFTRAKLQDALGVPAAKRRGNWDTGYTEYDGEYFVFSNVGTAGRNGPNHDGFWDGSELVWRAKSRTKLGQREISELVSDDYATHIFYRTRNTDAFTYAGKGFATEVARATPACVRWAFDENELGTEKQRAVLSALAAAGFEIGEARVQTQRATLQVRTKQKTLEELTCYVKRESSAFPLVIAPIWESMVEDLKLTGAVRPKDRFFYHNNTMRAFPKRKHTGRDEIPFGLDFDFPSVASIRTFVSALKIAKRPDYAESDELNVDPRTESEATRAARLGQTKFRRSLLEKFGGKCVISSVDIPELLRASHIKPWSVATARERLDPENGILLAVHLDGLFDKGLISFDDLGRVILSKRLTNVAIKVFGLEVSWQPITLSKNNKKYLAHHREKVFR
jgi:hypothetical protein